MSITTTLVALLQPEIAGARDELWTFFRVQSVLGPDVSLATCRRVMRRLEALGTVQRIGQDQWRRNL